MKFPSVTSALRSLTISVSRKRKKPTRVKDPRGVTGATYMATGETFEYSLSKDGTDVVVTESTAPPFSRSSSSSDFTSDQKEVLSAKLKIMKETGNKKGYDIPLEEIAKRASFENMSIADTGSDISEDDPERMELRQGLQCASDNVSSAVSQANMPLRYLDDDRGFSLCSSHSDTVASVRSEVPSTDVGFQEPTDDNPRPRRDREFSGFSSYSEHGDDEDIAKVVLSETAPQSPSRKWNALRSGMVVSTPERKTPCASAPPLGKRNRRELRAAAASRT